MLKRGFAIATMVLAISILRGFGDTTNAVLADLSMRVLQDPKTKVSYYVESDLRHVAAITPDGKLLWCCEVITGRGKNEGKNDRVNGLRFGNYVEGGRDKENFITVSIVGPGMGGMLGVLNRNTGHFQPGDVF
jgi:hypothetical protein